MTDEQGAQTQTARRHRLVPIGGLEFLKVLPRSFISSTPPLRLWECAVVEQVAASVLPPVQDYSPTVSTIFPICSFDSIY